MVTACAIPVASKAISFAAISKASVPAVYRSGNQSMAHSWFFLVFSVQGSMGGAMIGSDNLGQCEAVIFRACHDVKELYMAEAKQATLEPAPEWIDQVEKKIGWLWAQRTQAERGAVLRAIAAFLAKHDARLLELLNEGIQHLRLAFPQSHGFTITLEADREVSDWEYLVIRVKTTLSMEDAHTCMAAFDEEWLLDRSAEIGGTLLFDVEYA
jgi:hypothetical protein